MSIHALPAKRRVFACLFLQINASICKTDTSISKTDTSISKIDSSISKTACCVPCCVTRDTHDVSHQDLSSLF